MSSVQIPGSNTNACCLGLSSRLSPTEKRLYKSREAVQKRERHEHLVTSVSRYCFDIVKLSISKLIRWIKINTIQKLQG